MEKSLKQAVSEVLSAEVLKPPKLHACSKCGSLMQNATFTFSFGEDESWTLPLPVCVHCDAHELQGLSCILQSVIC